MGWALDRADSTDPMGPLSTFPVVAMAMAGADLTQRVSLQSGWLLNQILTTIIPLGDMSSAPSGEVPFFDSDVNVGAPNGNAGGATLARLKEGIERFLITDINNPAAGAMAQSTLFIMWDAVSTRATAFNHAPGGSNVLYMDGHVEFMKYAKDGKAPCNGSLAITTGAFGGDF